MIDRKTALDVVMGCLRDAMEQSGAPEPIQVTEDTVIVGKDAALDSVGVVSLIVDIEQRLEMDHDVSVTLANDKAMSQRSSPFRTVGVLADHVCSVAAEGQAA
jgi:acyl carrier protein